jgi:hypothetical protein
VLFVVLAVRWVLLAAGGTQRGWPGRAGYILGLVAIAVVGWLLTDLARDKGARSAGPVGKPGRESG